MSTSRPPASTPVPATTAAASASAPPPQAIFTWDGVARGFRATVVLAIFLIPFGMAVGVAASQAGLSPAMAVLMSLIAFGGAAQFAALELWVAPLPVLPILLTTAIVNARHLLYGAALHAWMAPVPPWKRNVAAAVMADVNWAMMMTARTKGERDAGFLLGSGIALWLTWVIGTWIGVVLGAALGDPRRFGLDVVMAALFATMLVGLWRGRDDIAPWIAAGAAALLALDYLPPGWHIIAGALTGGVVAVARFGWRGRP